MIIKIKSIRPNSNNMGRIEKDVVLDIPTTSLTVCNTCGGGRNCPGKIDGMCWYTYAYGGIKIIDSDNCTWKKYIVNNNGESLIVMLDEQIKIPVLEER